MVNKEETFGEIFIDFLNHSQTVAITICLIVFAARWINGKAHIGLVILFGILEISSSISNIGILLKKQQKKRVDDAG